MKFVKKLVIMVSRNCKGTAAFEKNAKSVSVAVNTYNLNNIKTGEYIFAVKCGDRIIIKTMQSACQKFELEDMDIDKLHCAIVYGDKCMMYGTNEPNRIWEGTFLEMVNREVAKVHTSSVPKFRHELSELAVKPIEFSKRPEIDDFFLDIMPKERYQDDAIAEVNYYTHIPMSERIQSPSQAYREYNSSNEETQTTLQKDLKYDSRNFKGESIEAKDRYDINNEATAQDRFKIENDKQNNQNIVKTESLKPTQKSLKHSEDSPSELERAYINTFLHGCLFRDIVDSEMKEAQRRENKKLDFEIENNVKKSIEDRNEIENVLKKDIEGLREELYNLKDETTNMNPQVSSEPNKSTKSNKLNEKRLSENKVNNEKFKPNISPKNILTIPDIPHILSDEAAATVPPINKDMPRLRVLSFYEQVEGQIKDLFDKYPKEQVLENLLPDTQWVKVDFDGKGRYYVVGLIKQDFICYGVPAKYSSQPPQELEGYCQWFPLEPTKPQEDGYWLMFQDAITGESVKRDIANY